MILTFYVCVYEPPTFNIGTPLDLSGGFYHCFSSTEDQLPEEAVGGQGTQGDVIHYRGTLMAL